MLSKRVCKQCAEETFFSWNENDDRYWNDSKVICSIISRQFKCLTFFDIVGDPPQKCPFWMEHKIDEQALS